MKRLIRLKQTGLAWIATLLIVAAVAPPARADDALSENIALELPKLAQSGRFQRLLDLLQSGAAGIADPHASGLIQDLQRYHQNEAQRQTKQLDSYNASLEEVDQHLQNQSLEEALTSAVAAHSFAANPQAMLQDPMIQRLVQQAESTAAQAQADNDWVQALSPLPRVGAAVR